MPSFDLILFHGQWSQNITHRHPSKKGKAASHSVHLDVEPPATTRHDMTFPMLIVQAAIQTQLPPHHHPKMTRRMTSKAVRDDSSLPALSVLSQLHPVQTPSHTISSQPSRSRSRPPSSSSTKTRMEILPPESSPTSWVWEKKILFAPALALSCSSSPLFLPQQEASPPPFSARAG